MYDFDLRISDTAFFVLHAPHLSDFLLLLNTSITCMFLNILRTINCIIILKDTYLQSGSCSALALTIVLFCCFLTSPLCLHAYFNSYLLSLCSCIVYALCCMLIDFDTRVSKTYCNYTFMPKYIKLTCMFYMKLNACPLMHVYLKGN